MTIIIPKSELGEKLHQIDILKQRATAMLAQLEATYAGAPVGRTGQWRQDPSKWVAIHKHGKS